MEEGVSGPSGRKDGQAGSHCSIGDSVPGKGTFEQRLRVQSVMGTGVRGVSLRVGGCGAQDGFSRLCPQGLEPFKCFNLLISAF